MGDHQLYLAIGVPIVVNAATLLLGFSLISTSLNKPIDSLRVEMHRSLDAIRGELALSRQMFTEQLRRVEEVMNARLKHLEER